MPQAYPDALSVAEDARKRRERFARRRPGAWALPAAGTARAAARGFGALALWVVRGNARARRFSERAGFVPDGSEEAYDVGGWRVPEVRYPRPLP
ncbi:hypothetical protein [Streptomyces sp. S186]|uniref:hypothetical protein n=1 Tax=Streptomyces sp. S186 TaxID=3434395 RepID=UPI003F67E842